MDLKEALREFCVRQGDDAVVLSHRVTEWCGHGPILEEDIALSNIGLDLLGQCQSLLNYAGQIKGNGRTADDYVYRRPENLFKNCLLVEQENSNYANTIARHFFYDVYHFYLLEGMQDSKDEFLRGFAQKSIKEVAYHIRHSSNWVLRFGDGTEESHAKIQEAVDFIWRYTGEMFENDEIHRTLAEAGIIPNYETLKSKWDAKVNEILAEATLIRPDQTFMATGGRTGIHSEKLGFLLSEMQYLVRAYPDAKWD